MKYKTEHPEQVKAVAKRTRDKHKEEIKQQTRAYADTVNVDVNENNGQFLGRSLTTRDYLRKFYKFIYPSWS